jgi:hypothetical protein
MLPERIEGRVQRTEGCWLWTGPLQKNGYGYTRWKLGTKWGHARVHRLFYEHYVEKISEGLEIDHICKVRSCVRPDHLRAVTHAENLSTRNHRGKARAEFCGSGQHRMTDDNVYNFSRGRACKACMAARSHAHYLKTRGR